jgi:hypothetical protein
MKIVVITPENYQELGIPQPIYEKIILKRNDLCAIYIEDEEYGIFMMPKFLKPIVERLIEHNAQQFYELIVLMRDEGDSVEGEQLQAILNDDVDDHHLIM